MDVAHSHCIVVNFELFIIKFNRIKIVKVQKSSNVKLRRSESSSENLSRVRINMADIFDFVNELKIAMQF